MFIKRVKEQQDVKSYQKKVEKYKSQTEVDDNSEFQVGDYICDFTGFLRLSKPSKLGNKTGMMAKVFGENGEDADIITVLGLTKFLNMPVKITIWGLKDKNGKLLRNKENKFPEFTQFIGKIQRPTTTDLGVTANFWGEDGGNADAINELNKTIYKDSLVKVLIQFAQEDLLLSEIDTITPDLEEDSIKLTPKEIEKIRKDQERCQEANQILIMSNFYGNELFLNKIGTIDDYKEWLSTKKCVVNSCGEEAKLYEVNSGLLYNFVPLCKKHIQSLESGEWVDSEDISDPIFYLKQINRQLILKYAEDKLKDILDYPSDLFIDPNVFYRWAVNNGLTKLVPPHYTSFVRKDF